ncbi:hypothetical protein IKE79_01060, partial [Candidatus Saccharibacteria bacterium]|nr:hypothetical protein [Candidatus Saccharibacteria bacterium]
MPINKSNIKPFACRVTRINGTRNKSITSNLARKGLKHVGRVLPLVFPPAASSRRGRLRVPREPFHECHPSGLLTSTIVALLLTSVLIPATVIANTSATTPLYFSVDSDPSMSITLQNASNVDLTNNSS